MAGWRGHRFHGHVIVRPLWASTRRYSSWNLNRIGSIRPLIDRTRQNKDAIVAEMAVCAIVRRYPIHRRAPKGHPSGALL
jgi:hypothetical protein